MRRKVTTEVFLGVEKDGSACPDFVLRDRETHQIVFSIPSCAYLKHEWIFGGGLPPRLIVMYVEEWIGEEDG